jgi:outer membrane lipoprotein
MKKVLALLAVLIWATSCAPFSKNIMDQVDPALTFEDVLRDPSIFQGKTVLWGGVIVETLNRPNETVIKVRQTELDLEKRPTNLDHSRGRFLIQYNGFLDPAIYKEGREITVAGEIIGKEVLPLGNLNYTYPLVGAKEIHLWERLPSYRGVYPYYPWYYDPLYPWGWYRPYWRHPYWW